jgi:hypothetical protein
MLTIPFLAGPVKRKLQSFTGIMSRAAKTIEQKAGGRRREGGALGRPCGWATPGSFLDEKKG